MYIKIIGYFTINIITRGFVIAFLSAGAIYLDWLGLVNYFLNTILGILTIYWLLQSDRKVWFWSGFWIGLLWFWWISISFINYGFGWVMPVGIIAIAFIYGVIFLILAKVAEFIGSKIEGQTHGSAPTVLIIKAIALLLLSYIHPFGFDWFKPELVFTNSYLGIEKWQFAIILASLVLTINSLESEALAPKIARLKPSFPDFSKSLIYKKGFLYLLLLVIAHPFPSHFNHKPIPKNALVISNSMITVKDKWNQKLQYGHVLEVLKKIDRAIANKKSLIIFPESIFAFFLNDQANLMTELQARSNDITIILGALYWDNGVPRNSTYIFKEGQFSVANKAILVPFGEQNPLPKWMGKLINQIFFDGAPDYVASSGVTDYSINGVKYRNAICFEGTSEKLYEGRPKEMILISNNGWFSPSIEPIQQKILLQYYSKKYGTTIYHSVNMSPSYSVHGGEVLR